MTRRTSGTAAPGKFQSVSQATGPLLKLSQIRCASAWTISFRTSMCTCAWLCDEPSSVVIVCDRTIMVMISCMRW